MSKTIRIGGAAGAWGDSALATAQLLKTESLDYIVYEALAEVTMAILTRLKMRNPQAGYAYDFIDPILKTHLREIRRQGIRVITNAGGINPQGAADALREIAREQGIELKVAVVAGDDLLPQLETLRAADVREMTHDTPLPKRVLAMNAYLGAFPIAKALDDGADVVITGRVVDSALMLAPCIHEFGWREDEYDKLAQGSLMGHLLECGTQSTGGLLTDWERVESWVEMGYPIAEVGEDSTFTLTKPPNTDGIVNIPSLTEQILYEIGDPRRYILPDVVCDFADVRLTDLGSDRVRVENAKGSPPPEKYKATTLEMDGYRLTFLLLITGHAAVRKARRVGETLFERARRAFPKLGYGDFRQTSLEIIGGETQFGAHARADDAREVMLVLAAHHDSRDALNFFAREIPSSGLSMAQGINGGGAGLPRPRPLIRAHSMLVPRGFVQVTVDGEQFDAGKSSFDSGSPSHSQRLEAEQLHAQPVVEVPLREVAYGRSGDKGNVSNVGIVARRAELVPVLRREVTTERVREFLRHLVQGEVVRYELPGLNAFNFVMQDALGGGGTASLRFDPLGKGMAQILLEMTVSVPENMLD